MVGSPGVFVSVCVFACLFACVYECVSIFRFGVKHKLLLLDINKEQGNRPTSEPSFLRPSACVALAPEPPVSWLSTKVTDRPGHHPTSPGGFPSASASLQYVAAQVEFESPNFETRISHFRFKG
jgi:hypothetical protein